MIAVLNMLKHLPISNNPTFKIKKVSLSELGKNYQKGKKFQLAGFTSTTNALEVMQTFLGKTGPRVLLELRLTGGEARDVSFIK